jgi:hypothetical protein
MMNRDVRRYVFKASIPAPEIENTLLLAIVAAEGLHGQSRVRLDAAYSFDADKHAAVIDVGSEVGLDVCRMFTGFAIKEFGAGSFSVSHAEAGPSR